MDPKGLFSLNFVLFLSLTVELSCGTGEGVLNCPKILLMLGRNVMLPLTYQGINKSMNNSIRILVTMANSPGNSLKKKIVSLDPSSEGGSPRYVENRYKFHLENLSLEILESRKEDEGWYSMTLEQNVSVQNFCLQLKLYEQVSTPEIKVLNRTQENGSCSLVLACTVEKGDRVEYSWSTGSGTHPLSPANGSHLLHLTLSPQHANDFYICTVSNPVSNRSHTFSPWSRCRPDPPDEETEALEEATQLARYVGLVAGIIFGVIVILLAITQLLRRRGETDQCQPTVEAKSLTIYAQVQKPGPLQNKPDALPAQDPCTTIYVAATEPVPTPVPASVQELNSITVYASVTLPES